MTATPRPASARPRGRTTVFLYHAAAGDMDADTVAALLAPEDYRRLATLTRPARRAEYLRGRALLRFALARETGRPAHSHRIEVAAHGKPECVDGPAISLSHDRDQHVCAVAWGGDVGIDVQVAAPGRDVEGIARHCFTADECRWLEGAPDGSFYMLWALKEAYLKCLGCGLGGGIDLLECRLDPPAVEARAEVPVDLALYAAGSAFIGVGTTGRDFPTISVERWPASSPSAAVAPIRLVATTRPA